MSTHKKIDLICVVVMVCSLLLTVIFMNGESLGMTKIVDEDSETYSDSVYFTANDQNGEWDVSDATVIMLKDDSASISGKGAYFYGGNVVISSAGYYVVSGTLSDGKLVVDAYDSSKVWIMLDGVEISCEDDACIRVDQADKVFLTLADQTENILQSGSEYSQSALEDGTNGAIFAHDDLTINGSGSLKITAGYKHGISANDDLVITGGKIEITAVKDGINVNDSIRIKDADIVIDVSDDGIATSKEDSYLYVESGSVDITSADDGIHSAQDVTIAGGNIQIAAGDDGIHADGNISIDDGVIFISECYEGLEALTIEVAGGDITIYPSDDGFNANGGSGDMFGQMGGGMGGGMNGQMGRRGDFQNGSSSENGAQEEGSASDTQNGQENEFSGQMASGEMPDMSQMASGEMPDMSQMQNGQMPGMENAQGTQQAADGGTETADADSEETYIRITGGNITIINETAQDADGLDSNGDIYISGGTIRVSLVNSGSNSALDYGSENGGVCEISGGNIIACGSYSMAEGFDSTSTQCSILYNVSSGIEAGTVVALEDAEGNILIEYEVPCSFSSLVVSCPEMVLGENYLVVIGDDVEEITLDEVSASFGNAQSTMFGGNMNWGGMQDRGNFGGMQGGFGGGRGSRGNGQFGDASSDGNDSSTSSNGSNGTDANSGFGSNGSENGEMPDMSQIGTPPERSGESAGGEMPDMSQMGMPQDGNGQKTGSDAEDTEETTTAISYTVTQDDLILLFASAVVLIAGVACAKMYRRRK